MAPGTNTGAAHPSERRGRGHRRDARDEGHQRRRGDDPVDSPRPAAGTSNRRSKRLLESASFTAERSARGGPDRSHRRRPRRPAARQLDGTRGDPLRRPRPRPSILTDATVVEVESSPAERFLSVLANPNIAYLLMASGMLGIYVEVTHPGAIFPGVVGVIAMLLALYSLSVLTGQPRGGGPDRRRAGAVPAGGEGDQLRSADHRAAGLVRARLADALRLADPRHAGQPRGGRCRLRSWWRRSPSSCCRGCCKAHQPASDDRATKVWWARSGEVLATSTPRARSRCTASTGTPGRLGGELPRGAGCGWCQSTVAGSRSSRPATLRGARHRGCGRGAFEHHRGSGEELSKEVRCPVRFRSGACDLRRRLSPLQVDQHPQRVRAGRHLPPRPGAARAQGARAGAACCGPSTAWSRSACGRWSTTSRRRT